MFSCEERGLEVEGVVQTRERRGDWGLVRGACLLARGAKVQNTNHWLEVGAASAPNQPLPVVAPQKLRSTCISHSQRKANLDSKSVHALAEIGW